MIPKETQPQDTRKIIDSLNRTKASIETGVRQSEGIVDDLQVDGELIKDALDEHSLHLKNALYFTRKRLANIKSSEWWEKYSLSIALGIFCAVVLYIVMKRLRVFSILVVLLRDIPSYFTSSSTVTDVENLAPAEYDRIKEDSVNIDL